jgi:hypothetical protein
VQLRVETSSPQRHQDTKVHRSRCLSQDGIRHLDTESTTKPGTALSIARLLR